MRAPTASAIALLLRLAAALPTEPASSATTLPESLSTATPGTSTAHLEIRQGVAVTAAPAAIIIGQVSPITTINIGYVKDGTYIQIQQVYTQTFATPVDQWPAATAGSVGLGTIEGAVGVVKTKRDVMPLETQLPVPDTDPLTLEGLREMMKEMPIDGDTSVQRSDLVLTTEGLNKLLAALPVEAAGGEKGVAVTNELLDALISALPFEAK